MEETSPRTIQKQTRLIFSVSFVSCFSHETWHRRFPISLKTLQRQKTTKHLVVSHLWKKVKILRRAYMICPYSYICELIFLPPQAPHCAPGTTTTRGYINKPDSSWITAFHWRFPLPDTLFQISALLALWPTSSLRSTITHPCPSSPSPAPFVSIELLYLLI